MKFFSLLNHRHGVYNFFITFPQTEVSREHFLNTISHFHTTKYLYVAQETHKDGGKHLHAIVMFTDKVKKKQLLDHFEEYYGTIARNKIHIGVLKSLTHAKRYLAKEDKQPLVQGTSLKCTSRHIKEYANLYEGIEEASGKCPCKEIGYPLGLSYCPNCAPE